MHVIKGSRPSASPTCLMLPWILVFAPATAQNTMFEEPLSERVANYDIDVTLNDEAKRLHGTVYLNWNNPSDDRVGELFFHLYTNAFRNVKSTFVREGIIDRADWETGEPPSENPWRKDNGWGGMNVTKMTVNGQDVTERIVFAQPDDNNTDDRSVIYVPLSTAIAPRATARIEITYEMQIPQCKVRMGWWQDDFFMMAHWFPKIGVYEPPGMRLVPADAPSGRWNCHQFHAGTEFYSNFGEYNVRITLPEKYIVGTTGLIVEESLNGDGTKTLVAHAEDVHEFAWVADAQFLEVRDIWRSKTTQRTVDIRLLYQPGHELAADKYIDATQRSLDYVENWLGAGAYPYPNVTVVDPRSGSGAGGMEYPTLFTGGAFWWMDRLFGEGSRITEMVTIHEFMHQIWYGVVASNEFEEAWLDEGLTSYSDFRFGQAFYGERTSWVNWWGLTASGLLSARASYTTSRSRSDGAIADPSFSHWRSGIGYKMSYLKSNLMLMTLEHLLGRERFDNIMRTYYQRWKFRHPTRQDFVDVANEVAGENLDWFFDQLIEQTCSLDYAVAAIVNVPIDELDEGILTDALTLPPKVEDEGDEDGDDSDEGDEEAEGEEIHKSTVVFRRAGDMIFPMETLVEFSDGEILRDTWDGRDRVRKVTFTRKGKVVRAAIDPEHHVPLDINRLNNSLRIEENDTVTNKYTVKGFFWMQSLLQFFSLPG